MFVVAGERNTYAKRRETGKEQRVQVSCDEGVVIHIGPEPCAVAREGFAEALTGGRIASHRAAGKNPVLGADAVHLAEGNTCGRVIANTRTNRGDQRPWHVQTLHAREPGDLAI